MKKKEKDHLNKNEKAKDFGKKFKCEKFKVSDLFDDESEIDLIRILKYDFDKIEKIPSVFENVASIILNSEKIQKLLELTKTEILASCPSEYLSVLNTRIDFVINDDSDETRKTLVYELSKIEKQFPELYLTEKIIRKAFLKILKEAKK